MSTGAVVWTALATLIVTAGPGAAIVLRRRHTVSALGAVAPVGTAVIGLGAVLLQFGGIPFGWWLPVAAGVALAAAILVGRRLRPRLRRVDPARPAPTGPGSARLSPALGAALLLSAAVLATITFCSIGAPDRISQTYDGIFHANAIARILSTGDASSFDLYRVNHAGAGNQFYPAAWHGLVAAVVQLSGASIPLASNVVWVVATAIAFLPGVVHLTDVVAPPDADRRVLLPVAALLGSGCIAFPYLLLSWGTLYPNALAYALLPYGVALAARFAVLEVPARRLLLPGAVWLVAEVFAHPRSLIGWGVILTPLALVALSRRIGPMLRDRRRRRRGVLLIVALAAATALAVAAVAVVVLRYFGAAQRPISERLNGGPAQAREPLWSALVQGATLTSPVPPTEQVAVPAVLLVLLLAIGAMLALRRPRLLWMLAALVAVVALYALAAGSNSDLAKIATGFWYKDKYRLMALLPMLAIPLMAIAAAWLIARTRGRRVMTCATLALVGATVVSGWATVAFGGAGASLAATFAMPAHDKGGRVLDGDEVRLLSRLDALVPAGELIVGNPWNGSSMSGVYSHRMALFPHVTGDWDADRILVATALDQAATNSAICPALDRLNAHYLVADPQLLFNGDPAAAFFSGIDRTVGTSLLTEVARSGSSVLYRISVCD